ncbi:MAG TPA: 4-hydroxy-tetrahydrodipicolinate reductase, partial [Lachnospiraceae bacterium]|nr:4-hydroxy-tetrahydrodipicolinate reductase [Lachnospiraceae bacterium]
MVRVIMHGCNGKMGQVISDIISQDDTMKIVAGIDP